MSFFKQILSSDSDQGSFSRLSGLVVIFALLVWSTVIVLRTPPGQPVIPDVPYYWLLMVVSLYGINKTLEAAKVILPAMKGEKGGTDAA